MGVKSKLLTWLILAVACNLAIRIILMLDLNKRVFNHTPGICKSVEGMNEGSEDIELLEDGIALISSGLRYFNVSELKYVKGRMYLVDLTTTEEGRGTPKAVELKIIGKDLDLKSFNPHGLSSYTSKGRVNVYVINHLSAGDAIECFSFSKDTLTLTHTKTIRDPLIYSANDLVVIGPDRFYVTNDHYFNWQLFRLFETYLMLSLGTLVYYDGQKASLADQWLLSPNGINMDKNKTHLYLSSATGEYVRVYKFYPDYSISRQVDVSLMTSPDNIFIEPDTGYLWIGCHPILTSVFKHLYYPKSSRSPSQVLRLRMHENHSSWTISEPYADDGRELSASTVAVFYNQQMLVGTISHKLMHCHVADNDLL